jgi:DNA processing protein
VDATRPFSWWLAWSLVPRVGAVTLWNYRQSLLPPDPPASAVAEADLRLRTAERQQAWWRCPDDSDYPRSLLALSAPPPVLWGQGPARWDDLLAIVGTRDPVPAAITAARWSAEQTVRAGHGVISGGARGVDAHAHAAALPHTVVALSSGLASEAAERNRALLDGGGTLLTEYSDDAFAVGRLFARNRLLVALSMGVLPIAATEQSGTLHAVAQARELGRPIGVWDAEWVGALRGLPTSTTIRQRSFLPWLATIAAVSRVED